MINFFKCFSFLLELWPPPKKNNKTKYFLNKSDWEKLCEDGRKVQLDFDKLNKETRNEN